MQLFSFLQLFSPLQILKVTYVRAFILRTTSELWFYIACFLLLSIGLCVLFSIFNLLNILLPTPTIISFLFSSLLNNRFKALAHKQGMELIVLLKLNSIIEPMRKLVNQKKATYLELMRAFVDSRTLTRLTESLLVTCRLG